MPLYLFRCSACGHTFETLTSIARSDAVVCEKCGKPVRRVYEGACAFGKKAAGGSGCSGNCGGCPGCGKK